MVNDNTDRNTPAKNSTRRTGRTKAKNMLLHIHPRRIPEPNLQMTHTWGLGGAAVTLIFLQLFTGLLLRFHYVATPSQAYDSIIEIQSGFVFGQLIRNVHHWSGMFLIVIAFLHLLRVFLTGAFLPPRHWNWMIGIALFTGVILSNFTGYLLPWDQLSYWAVTVSTGMLEYFPVIGHRLELMIRGGADTGTAALLNFYSFHTSLFPVLLFALMFIHFWKVRKAGGVILPRNVAADGAKPIDTVPHLINREIVVAVALLAFVFLFSLFFDAPLREKANPAFSPNPAKSPWYFQGIQELIVHFHPFFAVFVIPVILYVGLVALPFLKYTTNNEKTDFSMPVFGKIILWSAATAVVVTPVLILLDEYVFRLEEQNTGMPLVISNGLFPFLILTGLTWLFIFVIKKKFSNKKIDLILALFVLFTVSYMVLMLTGTFLRGEGMRLIFD